MWEWIATDARSLMSRYETAWSRFPQKPIIQSWVFSVDFIINNHWTLMKSGWNVLIACKHIDWNDHIRLKNLLKRLNMTSELHTKRKNSLHWIFNAIRHHHQSNYTWKRSNTSANKCTKLKWFSWMNIYLFILEILLESIYFVLFKYNYVIYFTNFDIILLFFSCFT